MSSDNRAIRVRCRASFLGAEVPAVTPDPPVTAWRDVLPARDVPTVDRSVQFLRLLAGEVACSAQGSYDPSFPNCGWFLSAHMELSTTLWIRSGNGNGDGADLFMAVGGPPEEVTVQEQKWIDHVARAVRAFRNEPVPQRPWAAILGPVPEQAAHRLRLSDWPEILTTAVTVGPMTVVSHPTWVCQACPSPADRSQLYVTGFWPTVVTGTVSAYTSPGALEAAADDLARLCQLLGLATDWRWTSWLLPNLIDGVTHERLVDDWTMRMHSVWVNPRPAPERQPLTVPDWVHAAWDNLIVSRDECAGGLAAYDAALGHLTEGRASDAGARFVAVLESFSSGAENAKERLAQGIDHAALYLSCKADKRQLSETDRRLAEEVVMPGRRHGTVHRGQRFGSDQRLNQPVGVVSINGHPARAYEWRVENLHRLCRALMLRRLGAPADDPDAIVAFHRELDEGVIVL